MKKIPFWKAKKYQEFTDGGALYKKLGLKRALTVDGKEVKFKESHEIKVEENKTPL